MEIILTSIQIIITICIVLFVILIIQIINNNIKEVSSILLNINQDLKRSAYNNSMFEILKCNTLKNLKEMKFKIQILIVLIFLSFISINLINYEKITKKYDKNFEVVIDSININNKKILDSLCNEINLLNDSIILTNIKFDSVIEINESLKKSNINLNNVIKHQNNIITNLKKDLDSK